MKLCYRATNIIQFKYSNNMVNHVFLISTAVNCETLKNPANGRVSYAGGTTYGQTATYSCNTGYTLVGGIVLALVNLQECGLGVHLPVKVA